MKLCDHCAAMNVNSAEFCTECGLDLRDVPPVVPPGGPTLPGRRIVFPDKVPPDVRDAALDRLRELLSADTLEMKREPEQEGQGAAAIMFLLDFTENAGGQADLIRGSVRSFVYGLRRAGLAVRVGLIELSDRSFDENGDS